ncbi:hypothetical protein XELAEV_18007604mg [Xenopus laevis]|nr:hypothetical protein XELAEV_18007604mg [Xenopus laevis]
MSNSSMSSNSLSARSNDDPGSQSPPRLLTLAQVPPGLEPSACLAKKVSVLEKRIEFLQREHADTLHSLHQEIHLLNKQNSDLKYELVMREKNNEVHRSLATGSNTGVTPLLGSDGHASVLTKYQLNSDRQKMRQMYTGEEFHPGHTANTRMEVARRYQQPR